MARQRFYHDPARKHIETYQDFSGGLNTMNSNDNIKDNELTVLENVDLGDRGSLKRRKGFRSERIFGIEGKPQGLFRFHRNFTPYNLLGIEGAFDGQRKVSGDKASIGGWYAFNLTNNSDAYKIDRDDIGKTLIVNGDFEQGKQGWALDIDKMEVGDSLVGKSVNAYSGNNVLRIRSFKGHSGYLNEYYKHEIPASPGEQIYAETFVRRAAVSIGNIPYRAHLVVSFKKSNGTRERFYKSTYNVDTKWQKISETFTAPAGTVSFRIGVGILDKDTSQDIAAYFDNVKAFKRSGNLVVNGGFENGSTGWVLDVGSTGMGDSLAGRSESAYSGQNVLRIRRFKGYKGILNEYQEQEIPVKAGDKIEAETRYRQAAVSIGYAPRRVHLVASVLLKNGTRTRMYANAFNCDSTWRRLTHTFTMPKDAVSVLIGVGIQDNNTSRNAAAYFDNVRAYKHEQMLTNYNFEQGEKDWELDVDGLKAGDSLIGESAYAYSGQNVLRIRRFKGHTGYYNEYQDWKHEIPTREGETFYAEVMYRQAAASIGAAPYRVHLIASVRKKDGSRERFYVNKYDCDNEWRKLSGYFEMPKNAVGVLFGVGIIDNASQHDVAAYFDNFYVRKEIQGSTDSAVAIRSTTNDTKINRGLGLRFTGIEPNKYYVYLVDYRSEGANVRGAIAIRDERYGVYPRDYALVKREEFVDTSGEWRTKYMKFKTGEGIREARAYVYNYSDLGVIGTAFYDNARIYEVTAEEYEKIGVDPDYSGEALGRRFPFLVGKLTSETITDTIIAQGGKFYVNGVEMPVEGDITIQSDRPMEAAAYKNNLYIASGSGLLVYNGSTIAKVSPYIPDSLETLYVGSNALVDNPYELSDTEQTTVQIQKLMFSRRYGVTNKDITLRVAVGKPSGLNIEYKFERRNVRDKEDYWFTLQDWSSDNEVTFNTNIAGEYQFRVTVRKKGESQELDQYFIPKYIIKPTEDESDRPIDGNTIDLCNRILVHWERLILYGDESKPDVVYISDVFNPEYFPVNNTLQFENPRKERITSIVKYRDSLAVFTPSSIQALHGTSPEDYVRVMLNTDVGCIADRSAKVVKNSIVFLSYEGITELKTVGTSETKSNVGLLDKRIKSLVSYDEEAVAYVRDNQYCIVYPKENKQLRYYYEWDVWTMDTSPSLDFIDVIVEDSKIIALGDRGRLIQDDDMNYSDEGEVFEAKISTKLYNFGESYSPKKTRELQIMFDNVIEETTMRADTFIDIPYSGDKIVKTIDFDYNITPNDSKYWIIEITPSHSNTLKKGLAHDAYAEREGISNFAHRKEAVMAFSASGALSNGGLQGLQVTNGVVHQIRNSGQRYYETLAIMEDGTLKIIDGYETTDPDLTGVKHTFHFGPYLIKDGVKRTTFPGKSEYIEDQKHPRQAIGQRADGTIVIITVDGRSDIAEGMDLHELADLFEQQECVVAYNLDGGGSAQSFVEGQPLNVYSDGMERKIGDFIYFTKDDIEIIEGDKSGLISSQEFDLVRGQDVYKVPIPGKGINVGTFFSHKDNKPFKLVGISYIFKLKKP